MTAAPASSVLMVAASMRFALNQDSAGTAAQERPAPHPAEILLRRVALMYFYLHRILPAPLHLLLLLLHLLQLLHLLSLLFDLFLQQSCFLALRFQQLFLF